MTFLDTNVIVSALNGRAPLIAARLERETLARSILVSAIVLFELRFGIANGTKYEENTRRLKRFIDLPITIVDFDSDDATEAGDIRADLHRLGTPIGPYDVLIAAQARRRGATLVTANTREFSRVPGLRLEDWTTA